MQSVRLKDQKIGLKTKWYLNETVGTLCQHIVGASLVVELHLNGVVRPTDGQVVVFAIVNLNMGESSHFRQKKFSSIDTIID